MRNVVLAFGKGSNFFLKNFDITAKLGATNQIYQSLFILRFT